MVPLNPDDAVSDVQLITPCVDVPEILSEPPVMPPELVRLEQVHPANAETPDTERDPEDTAPDAEHEEQDTPAIEEFPDTDKSDTSRVSTVAESNEPFIMPESVLVFWFTLTITIAFPKKQRVWALGYR